MRMMYYFIIILFFALLGGCQQKQQTLTEAEKEAIKKEVKVEFNQLVSASKQLDIDKWSEKFSKNEFVSVVLGADYYNDRNKFLNTVKTYFSMRERQKIDSIKVQITVLSSNSVLLTSEENFQVWLKEGSSFQLKDAFSTLWKKEQGGWKIIFAHESWMEK